MALADFVLVIVEIAVVQIELNTKDQIRQTLYNSHEDFEETKVGKIPKKSAICGGHYCLPQWLKSMVFKKNLNQPAPKRPAE